jgi:signal transduction histidine kinase
MAGWLLNRLQSHELALASPQIRTVLTVFDLTIESLISLVAISVGQAIVSYEIFTGKALPRGGLFRRWQAVLVIAALYGTILAASLDVLVDPVYYLLLATVLMTVFFGLLTWSSYAEREKSVESLRPFVISQRHYEHMLTPTGPFEEDISLPFEALCSQILGAQVAYLSVIGSLSPLIGRSFAFPSERCAPSIDSLASELGLCRTLCLPIDASSYQGAHWAVPLWGERGLIGALLLGEKRDGSLYAQEEIELARDIGERLVDSSASAEIARRLMDLQRQRLVESQVLDQTARRVLHDEVLPSLHAALLSFSSARQPMSESIQEAVELLTNAHQRITALMRSTRATPLPDLARLGVLGALRQALDHDKYGAFDSVSWKLAPEAERQLSAIPDLIAEVTFCAAREVIRNAAQHGRGGDLKRALHLYVEVVYDDRLRISIEDDGVGMRETGDAPSGGSGRGLALHSTMMAVVGGTMTTEIRPSGGTKVVLTLPMNISRTDNRDPSCVEISQ